MHGTITADIKGIIHVFRILILIKAMDEKDDMDLLKANNMRLLTNILPTHVAEHFLRHQVNHTTSMSMIRNAKPF